MLLAMCFTRFLAAAALASDNRGKSSAFFGTWFSDANVDVSANGNMVVRKQASQSQLMRKAMTGEHVQ